MGFAWRWTLSPRTGAQGGAGKSSSSNSGWRKGGAELVVLGGIYWPAQWEHLLLSWSSLRIHS